MLRKGLKRDILILLAVLVDDLSAYTFKNQMRRLLCQGWYKRTNFGPTVSRLLSVGDIERVLKDGKPFYRLTSKGSKRLKESVSLLKLASKSWDRCWRMVIFDIKEEKKFLREALRDKLLSLGFGMWQRSVYITPHDIEQEINQYLQAKKLFPSCVCLVARRSDLGDDRALANRVWRLEELNQEYEEFIWDCQELTKKIKEGKAKQGEWAQLWQRLKELILKDPYLPRELLPEGWLAEKARKEFRILCNNMTRSQLVNARKSGRGRPYG